MKKLSAILLAFALVFSNVGTVVLFGDADTAVEAKRYKSGKKGFSNSPGSTNNNNVQKNDATTNDNNVNKATNNNTNKSTNANTNNKGGFSSGGLMKGFLVGGLAGLLFGSLFADMGVLGSILGLLINVGAIALIAFLIFKIYFMLKRKNEKEVS